MRALRLTRQKLAAIPPDMHGILYMVMSAFWFAAMTAIVRYLSADLHPFVIVFYRNAFALMFMLPWLYKNGLVAVGKSQMKLYTWRGFNGLASMLFWFYSLASLPLAQAISLSFTTPLFTTLAAMVFLKERVGKHRWTALIIGFLGTLVILRPGMHGFDATMLLVLVSSSMWAVSNIIIKRLTATESPFAITFYMTLFMTPIAIPFALWHWQVPTLTQFFWLILLGITSNLAQLSISHAYQKADVSIVQPFDFSRLIFAAVIAYFAFNEVLDMLTLVGAVIIASSTVYITHREARLKKKRRLDDMEVM